MKNVLRLVIGCLIAVVVVDIVATVYYVLIKVFNLYNIKELDLISISLDVIVIYALFLLVVLFLMLFKKKK